MVVVDSRPAAGILQQDSPYLNTISGGLFTTISVNQDASELSGSGLAVQNSWASASTGGQWSTSLGPIVASQDSWGGASLSARQGWDSPDKLISSLFLAPGLHLFLLDPVPTFTFRLAAELSLQVLDGLATVTP